MVSVIAETLCKTKAQEAMIDSNLCTLAAKPDDSPRPLALGHPQLVEPASNLHVQRMLSIHVHGAYELIG